MGYYPPYVPDTYIQIFRPLPSSRIPVKRVEAIQYKHIERKKWEGKLMLPDEFKKETGLGVYFDQYI